ncbi:MAG: endonuclease III [Thermodesulfobacteriota bacterium]
MNSEPKAEKIKRAGRILDILSIEFPGARSALKYSNPLELLVSTILSAQATDTLVNKVTGELFRKYRTPGDYAGAEIEELEADIGSVNFFRNKARNIKKCCARLVDVFDSKVPSKLTELVSLPGVGRKTANIVLGNAFGLPALAVDTHVKRVSTRLGLTRSEKPDDIEQDLMLIIDKERWTLSTHLLILHGRKTCKARTPLCDGCPVNALCDYYKEPSL